MFPFRARGIASPRAGGQSPNRSEPVRAHEQSNRVRRESIAPEKSPRVPRHVAQCPPSVRQSRCGKRIILQHRRTLQSCSPDLGSRRQMPALRRGRKHTFESRGNPEGPFEILALKPEVSARKPDHFNRTPRHQQRGPRRPGPLEGCGSAACTKFCRRDRSTPNRVPCRLNEWSRKPADCSF